MTYKTGQFDDVKPILGYKSINLNAQHVNGMTHIGDTSRKVIRFSPNFPLIFL